MHACTYDYYIVINRAASWFNGIICAFLLLCMAIAACMYVTARGLLIRNNCRNDDFVGRFIVPFI